MLFSENASIRSKAVDIAEMIQVARLTRKRLEMLILFPSRYAMLKVIAPAAAMLFDSYLYLYLLSTICAHLPVKNSDKSNRG